MIICRLDLLIRQINCRHSNANLRIPKSYVFALSGTTRRFYQLFAIDCHGFSSLAMTVLAGPCRMEKSKYLPTITLRLIIYHQWNLIKMSSLLGFQPNIVNLNITCRSDTNPVHVIFERGLNRYSKFNFWNFASTSWYETFLPLTIGTK